MCGCGSDRRALHAGAVVLFISIVLGVAVLQDLGSAAPHDGAAAIGSMTIGR